MISKVIEKKGEWNKIFEWMREHEGKRRKKDLKMNWRIENKEKEERSEEGSVNNKKGEKAKKKKKIEEWVKDKLRKGEFKIVKGLESKEAVKVFFRSRREFGRGGKKWREWGEWGYEEKNKRFIIISKTKELKEKIRKNWEEIDSEID